MVVRNDANDQDLLQKGAPFIIRLPGSDLPECEGTVLGL